MTFNNLSYLIYLYSYSMDVNGHQSFTVGNDLSVLGWFGYKVCSKCTIIRGFTLSKLNTLIKTVHILILDQLVNFTANSVIREQSTIGLAYVKSYSVRRYGLLHREP